MKPHQLRAIAFATLLPIVAAAQSGTQPPPAPQDGTTPGAERKFPAPTVLPPVLEGTLSAASSPVLEAKASAPMTPLIGTTNASAPATPLVGTTNASEPATPLVGATNAFAPATLLIGDTNAPSPASRPTLSQQATLIPSPGSVLPVKGDIRLNFQNASLSDVLAYLSEAAGFVILQEQPVNGTVTIVSRQSISADEAIDLLNAVLIEKGYAAIRNGRILKIVSRSDAQKRDIPVMEGSDPEKIPRKDQMVTQVLPLRYLDSTKLVENLRPLLSADATINANESSNAVLIVDTQTNIHRIAEIIHALDTSVSSISTIRVYQLQYADSKSLAATLTQLFAGDALHNGGNTPQQQGGGRGFGPMAAFFGGGRGGGGGETAPSLTPAQAAAMKVIAVSDDQSNSVIISAPSEVLITVTDIITRIDTPTIAVTETRIFQLEHADATEMAGIINSLYGGMGTQPASASAPTNGNQRFNQPQQPRPPQPNPQNSSQRTLQEASVVAVAAPRTNSVLITAARDTMSQIALNIGRLDIADSTVTETRLFQLQHADATELSNILNSLYSSTGSTQPSTGGISAAQRTTQPRPQQQTTSGAGGVGRAAQESTVVAVPDPRTNTMLVSAARDTMPQIALYIGRLDSTDSKTQHVYVYSLQNADPDNVATILRGMFSSQNSSSTSGAQPTSSMLNQRTSTGASSDVTSTINTQSSNAGSSGR